jgi:hypothetical protein
MWAEYHGEGVSVAASFDNAGDAVDASHKIPPVRRKEAGTRRGPQNARHWTRQAEHGSSAASVHRLNVGLDAGDTI